MIANMPEAQTFTVTLTLEDLERLESWLAVCYAEGMVDEEMDGQLEGKLWAAAKEAGIELD